MALAGLLAVPTGAAFNWAILGTHEPDNTDDTSEFMWQDAPGSAQKRVYFAVVTTTGGESLNVAALGTNQEAPTEEFSYAFLGRWVDCNGDGYVGNAETAMWEYDSALLLDTSVCPPATGSPNRWDAAQSPNYNNIVSEFIPIGGSAGDPVDDQGDQRVYRDGDAAVWGDYGRPTDGAGASFGTCALTPLPRGTLASTGGIINYAGCTQRFMQRWNNVFRDGQGVGGNPLPPADPTNSLGLWFEDERDARVGNHPLDVDTFGSEDSSHTAVYVFDCSATPLLHVGDVTNSTGLNDAFETATGDEINSSTQDTTIWAPGPRVGDTSDPAHSLPGTVNETNEETEWSTQGCNTSNDRGADFYGFAEGDFNSVSATNKKESDQNFAFNDGQRGQAPESLGTRWPGDAGGSDGFGIGGPVFLPQAYWSGDSTLIKTTGPRSVRANLDEGTAELAGAYWLTFYAKVGTNTTSTYGLQLPGGSAVYGQPQCGSFTTGIHNGWNCDGSLWYANPDGTATPEPHQGLARPGWVYQLRDSDCYDGSNDLGVPTGVAAVGPAPCPH